MSGIERLRAIAGAWDEWGLGGTLAEIADQIERELQEERDRWDSELCEAQMDKSRVTAVYLEMNKHCIGHEGMEDSPVARWARELREALGGAVTDEDREAAEWVRDHGGLDYVKAEWRSRVPYDRYVRKRQHLLRHIAECETALGRRREIISGLGRRVRDLTTENAELRKRAMPEGCEWPRYEDDEPVLFGDIVENRYGTCTVNSVRFYKGGGVSVYGEDEGAQFVVVTEPVMHEPIRKARPKVIAADGEPLKVGQTVWDIESGEELKVEELCDVGLVHLLTRDGVSRYVYPDQLTHQRPDTWQRIEEDALNFVEDNAGIPHDQDQMERDMLAILRRCRALADRERGE